MGHRAIPKSCDPDAFGPPKCDVILCWLLLVIEWLLFNYTCVKYVFVVVICLTMCFLWLLLVDVFIHHPWDPLQRDPYWNRMPGC